MTHDPRPTIKSATDALKFDCVCDHAIDDSYVAISWTPSRLPVAPKQLRALSAAMNAIGYRRCQHWLSKGNAAAKYHPKGVEPTTSPTECGRMPQATLRRMDAVRLTGFYPLEFECAHVVGYERGDTSWDRAKTLALTRWRAGDTSVVVTDPVTARAIAPHELDWSTVPKAPSGKSGKSKGRVVRVSERTASDLDRLVPSRYQTAAAAIEAGVKALDT